jgi:hypothetical protein
VWKLPAAKLVTDASPEDHNRSRRSDQYGDRLEQRTNGAGPENGTNRQDLQHDQVVGLQGDQVRGDRLEASSVRIPALRVNDALAELRREGSGPHLTATNRRDGAIGGEDAREWLTKAVLTARGMPTARWERHAAMVEEAYRRWAGAAR